MSNQVRVIKKIEWTPLSFGRADTRVERFSLAMITWGLLPTYICVPCIGGGHFPLLIEFSFDDPVYIPDWFTKQDPPL